MYLYYYVKICLVGWYLYLLLEFLSNNENEIVTKKMSSSRKRMINTSTIMSNLFHGLLSKPFI